MTPPKSPPPVTVLRPSVLAAIVYFGLCSVWALWALVTTKHPTLESGEPLRLLSWTQYLCVTGVNVAFALAFLADGRVALRGPHELRRAHLVGLIMSAVILVLLQLGAHKAYGPIGPH